MAKRSRTFKQQHFYKQLKVCHRPAEISGENSDFSSRFAVRRQVKGKTANCKGKGVHANARITFPKKTIPPYENALTF